MTLLPRTAVALGLVAFMALVAPAGVAVLLAVAVLAVAAADAWVVHGAPDVRRTVSPVLSRAQPAALALEVRAAHGSVVHVRQPQAPDVLVAPATPGPNVEMPGAEPRHLDARRRLTVTVMRRGRHVLPAPVLRTHGPLGLGAWQHTVGEPTELQVFPDLPGARRLALAVRDGRFRDPGLRTLGHIGLGTAFERVRDYLPDDDIRQVNWRVTARAGRPMSNQYRVETDQEILLLVDVGRLMGTPVGDGTRLDAALDAAAALALVADVVGDRCGAVAFDDAVRRRVRPGRASGDAVVRATFDLAPSERDADHELAFRVAAGGKRALVVVLTDLVDEAAARALVDAIPILARRHAVVVASVLDPDLDALTTAMPATERDVLETVVALDVLAARARAVARVRCAGAAIVEAPPGLLPAACVRAYLRGKRRL